MVKKCGMLKIIHDKYKQNRRGGESVYQDFVSTFDNATEHNKELDGLLTKTQVFHRVAHFLLKEGHSVLNSIFFLFTNFLAIHYVYCYNDSQKFCFDIIIIIVKNIYRSLYKDIIFLS